MAANTMRNASRWVATTLATTVIIGCQTSPYDTSSVSREDLGTVAGGVLGAAVGSQIGSGSGRTAAMIGGALLGGIVGKSVGRRMDERDRLQAGQTLETTRTDQSSTWVNPDTGYRYTMTPTNTYASAGRPCRDFVTTAVIEGRRETLQGTACRQQDGTWQVVQ